jgi:hypothetical protein
MNIREIRINNKNSITIVTIDNHIKTFKKENLNGLQRTWFDNVIACSISLIHETPTK